ncbi:MAG: ferritin [Holosporaceae bacterium]|jgi:ferritin|nr:ferritin [Holosporaceae bacterium]
MAVSIGKRSYEALNKQITEEFASGYLYIAMSSVFKDMGLDGCASWIMQQSQERCRDAMKIYDHMQQRSAKIKLLPIPAPKQEWRAPLHIFEEVMRNTQKNTQCISGIYELSMAEKDYQTQSFIMWFISKQVEEEAQISSILDRLRKMQSTELGVLIFDAELGKKV